MNPYLKLSLLALLPIGASIIFYLLEKRTKFGSLKRAYKQTIIGIVFGISAIISTEFGADLHGVVANVRDASVLIAGLIFGAPAGIIAGFIGGIERAIAVLWGAGRYTMIACSLSTIFAGFIGAILRKYMFDDKKPTWIYGFLIGVVVEVMHMLMIFITNMNDIQYAYAFVEKCATLMIFVNAIAVTLAILAVTIVGKERIFLNKKARQLSSQFQKWLFVVVILSGLSTCVFTYFLQNGITTSQSREVLNINLQAVTNDIQERLNDSDSNIEKEEEILIISETIKYKRVGETGTIVVLDNAKNVVCAEKQCDNTIFEDISFIDTNDKQVKFRAYAYGENNYMMYDIVEDYYVVAIYPIHEAEFMRDLSVYITVFMEVIVFACLFILIYFLIKKIVVTNIKKVNSSLAQITDGNLDTMVNVRTTQEFASLSDDINTTVDTLKNYIAEAGQRIDKELEFAKSIQQSALPSVFPPYPNRKDFDIFASMTSAKEVGGDFYDFYFVGENEIIILIADVSGKGIPAAMFMMRAKSIMKDYAETGIDVNEILTRTNAKLCEGNEADMFVTAWIGKLNLSTGYLSFASAGHNPPILYKKESGVQYLKGFSGLVLGGMDGVAYKKNETTLEKDDFIYLYTDGVTEAININNELYGEQRLKVIIDNNVLNNAMQICTAVKADVDNFALTVPQFDDITMLLLRYKGNQEENKQVELQDDKTIMEDNIQYKELELDAKIENIEKFTDFVDTILEDIDCSMKEKIAIDIALDEILSNIVRYAYPNNNGTIVVKVSLMPDSKVLEISFADRGVQFNPLEKENPDIQLSAEDRQVGGLGIFIVKNSMDNMEYCYENGVNILKITKRFE